MKRLPLIARYSAIVYKYVNATLHLKRIIITLPGYQISLTSCTKQWNDERLNEHNYFAIASQIEY